MSNLKAYKYRLYPDKKQAEKLQWTLDRARELYNAALQERRDAYEIRIKRHPNYHDEATRKQLTQEHALTYIQQTTQLPAIKVVRPEYNDIHSQVLQDVLRRVDKAYQAFFRRVKEGKTPGYPRFHGYGRYDSFTFPQSGFSLTEDNRVCLSKIGTIKVKFPKGKNCPERVRGALAFLLLWLLSGSGPQRREKHPTAWIASPRNRILRSDGALRGRASEKPPAFARGVVTILSMMSR